MLERMNSLHFVQYLIIIALCFLGYRQLFQPVIKQVVDFYQPTCIVLQVIIWQPEIISGILHELWY